jgi:hypothetical protein
LSICLLRCHGVGVYGRAVPWRVSAACFLIARWVCKLLFVHACSRAQTCPAGQVRLVRSYILLI